MVLQTKVVTVRLYDETNKRVSYDNVNLETEYTLLPDCAPPIHRFPIGSKVCQCKKYDGTDKYKKVEAEAKASEKKEKK